jgi:hypothetical protein
MLRRINVTGDLEQDAMHGPAVTRWFNLLQAIATKRGLSNLVGSLNAHRLGYLEGLSPEQELQYQIDAAWKN